MRVIICDDEKSTCAELEQMLINYASERALKLDVDVFFFGDVLTRYLYREEAPDILFLDIELPGLDGVAVGGYIRRVLENEQIFIIYISSKETYALQLFKNRLFDFLVHLSVFFSLSSISGDLLFLYYPYSFGCAVYAAGEYVSGDTNRTQTVGDRTNWRNLF